MNKRRNSVVLISMVLLILPLVLSGQTADRILQMVDEKTSGDKAPADTQMTMTMKIHQGNSVKIRELKAWTKNISGADDWRVMKFISPPDVAGIGLLVRGENQMYLYLPEFRRIRRIASSTKNNSFQGSDFSYHDLEIRDFSGSYQADLMDQTEETWRLELKRKRDADRPYERILLTVDKEAHMPLAMEMYDDNGTLWKKMTSKIVKVDEYHIMSHFRMEDKKKGSFTLLEMKDIEVDQDIDDEVFTQRFLKRRM